MLDAACRSGNLIRVIYDYGERIFDALAALWEGASTRKTVGTLLVAAYLGALVLIELNRQGFLPPPFRTLITTNHFGAVYLAFTLLLVMEILGLVFALAQSVANSMGKQFELLSLILLRKAFLQFSEFGEPIVWDRVSGALLEIVADATGALLVFVVLGFYYRAQKHRKIVEDEIEQASFIAAKKILACLLLFAFALLGLHNLQRQLAGEPYAFFAAFYLLLIFTDILVVLIAFRYSTSFRVLFRNAGFAIATVLIRLALTAPAYLNALLGVGAALFALAISIAYNAFAPVMREQRAPLVDQTRK